MLKETFSENARRQHLFDPGVISTPKNALLGASPQTERYRGKRIFRGNY
jgi:hypothetical protein